MAQDAKTVIANAQKAMGDLKSISYSGTAKDVAFQQCGANSTDMNCRGTHDPMRPITNYVRVIDLAAPASRASGTTNNIVLSWSPVVTAPSGKPYIINGYVNDQNLVERVETWLGENIMGDMQILATYTGWKEYAGFMAPSKIVQTRGGWPFFEVDVT